MRNIEYIVVHCTAGSQKQTLNSIRGWWRRLGWKTDGYHYLIFPDGTEYNLVPEDKPSNGVAGWNSKIINVCYVGGVDTNLKPIDNRTLEQRNALNYRLRELKKKYPNAKIQGHRDFPGVKKACPSFDAKKYYEFLN